MGTDSDEVASLSELVLHITLQDRYAVGLASVNSNSLRSTLAGQGLAKKTFGGSQIAIFTEIELNRIAVAADSTTQVQPFAFDLDVGFIEVPFSYHRNGPIATAC